MAGATAQAERAPLAAALFAAVRVIVDAADDGGARVLRES